MLDAAEPLMLFQVGHRSQNVGTSHVIKVSRVQSALNSRQLLRLYYGDDKFHLLDLGGITR